MKLIAQSDIQAYVFAALQDDTVISALCPMGVSDGTVPPGKTVIWPYLILDSFTEEPDDRLSNIGRTVTFLVHVHSQYQGSKEAQIVADRIAFLLDHKYFSTPDWRVRLLTLIQANIAVQTDEYRHLIMRFKASCQPLP